MTCKSCGATIEENAKFCSACGTAVNQPEQEKPELVLADEPKSNTGQQQKTTQQSMPQPDTTYHSTEYSGMAIAGFVLSFVFCILGIIFSAIGIKECNETGKQGKGLAIAGLVISIVTIGVWIIFLCAGACAVGTIVRF